MCGRFARKSTQQVLADWFGVDLEDMPFFAPTFNAAPQSVQPVLRLNRDSGGREFALMRWGLVPYWAKDTKMAYTTINARAEEIAGKATYRDALKKRRCLIPADAFYEWQKLGAKTRQPYAIALKSGEPYAFAGLWERWQPKVAPTGPDEAPLPVLETFTIVTTDPNQLMEPIHDRMPVLLERSNYDRWLEPGDPAQLPVDLLRPYPAEQMAAWKVSDRVGNVRNDDAQLLDPDQPAQNLLFEMS